MTVRELKLKLNKFDESLEVGGVGHYGELLNIESVAYYNSSSDGEFINLEITDAGRDPGEEW